ncbi:impB/mucB/samB family protein [Colletotrichum graminicola M1.001]|uniref:ImpB/mucB/samB family protein n=1 Tax=Colletotrichum graminicola (strain M1.001 / M2 / FGSC 10212) TaxID=645133 RepID=E3QGU1_COLGM|nr:impB/mucB/samB family protein [Colletotrichum graminicola M1.001]EFQ30079.1 impB/mucB/samB family protein [Colletotrichum graminicola M1.001]
MDLPRKRVPGRRDDRIILHFDYDCFYASVYENRDPRLKALPLGVKQKNILATCNYVARKRGVKKLMLIVDAKKLCPDLVIIDGEDLTPFRDMSKRLFRFLRGYSWNNKAERLGFDEVFMDVTDIIDYNMFCINRASLSESFFHLSKQDPENGFICNLTKVAGCIYGMTPEPGDLENPNFVRLLLASHLAFHLRMKLEEDLGFTASVGVSTNKLLSKLAGSVNKPRNQTTLMSVDDSVVAEFMDTHSIRKVPGIGFKTSRVLEGRYLSTPLGPDDADRENSPLKVQNVRTHPGTSPDALEKLLGGPGSERGVGERIWGLLHGVDDSEVKDASDIPSQISIEDTFKGLESMSQIEKELRKISASLVRRMRTDLLTNDDPIESGGQRWIAHPKTLRLSIRSWPTESTPSFQRISRSQPLPNFIFTLKEPPESIAERLTSNILLPSMKKFYPPGHQWNLQLMNVCVANMAASGSEARSGVGRDISVMFRKQDDVLRQWRMDTAVVEDDDEQWASEDDVEKEMELGEFDEGASWEDDMVTARCPICGHCIPPFALAAHARYHDLGE